MIYNPCDLEKEFIEIKVHNALNKLFKNDNCLLKSNSSEKSISHKLAEHLQVEFDDWNVDCEYNRDRHDQIKKLHNLDDACLNTNSNQNNGNRILPDIIIHHRNTRNNLLIIEIKKTTNNDDGYCDKKKIKAFIEELSYKFGLFIRIGVKEKSGKNDLDWLSD